MAGEGGTGDGIELEPGVTIPMAEFTLTFARSSGPGGQNVNKVNTKVQLRWNPAASRVLPDDLKARLMASLAPRLTTEGDLLVVSETSRHRQQNLEDCLRKLEILLKTSLRPRKRRIPTHRTRGSKERRIADKKIHSRRKDARRRPQAEE